MKRQQPRPLTYNDCVQLAYFKLLSKAKRMLSNIEQDELRFTLERQKQTPLKAGTVIHELVNPLLYMRLEWHADDQIAIHFGIECLSQPGQLSTITSSFLRYLYQLTSKGLYPKDIDDCVRTDWFINSCSALYEYLEASEHYKFSKLAYKVTASQRKAILAVA